MRNALKDLNLQRLDLVHDGDETFPLGKKIRSVALIRLLDDLNSLR